MVGLGVGTLADGWQVLALLFALLVLYITRIEYQKDCLSKARSLYVEVRLSCLFERGR
jgi:hypothetical protein